MTNDLAAMRLNWATIHEEAKGVVRIEIIRPTDVPGMVQQHKAGNAYYTTILLSMSNVDTETERRAQTADPVLCLCCPRPVLDPYVAVHAIIIAAVDNPASSAGCLLCNGCARADDIGGRMVKALRAVWPDGREIKISAAAGHA